MIPQNELNSLIKIMTVKEFIIKFANSIEIEVNRYSCLSIAINDARKISGRNLETGEIQNDLLINNQSFLNPYSLIGIINYLLILDMIGEIFQLEAKTIDKGNIYKALYQFSNLKSEKDIGTIVALRNSLAHNYGLINIPYDSKKYATELHKFTLYNTSDIDLIEYPTNNWNLDFNDKRNETSTKISVIKLQELVENVYLKLKDEIQKDNVELRLKGGVDELKARFTIQY